MQKLKVNKDIIQDVINMVNGVYAPLVGFLRKNELKSVLDNMRLPDGSVWSMPIVLDIGQDDYARIKNENAVILESPDGKVRAVLENIEIYPYNKQELARKVYGTLDHNHPGVAETMAKGDYLVGGDAARAEEGEKLFNEYNLAPAETRKIFNNRGWQTIVAFQTRNVPHRGHEFLQKQALKDVDGLFVQPVIGEKKPGDFKDEYIISAYEVLLDKYYPKNKTVLGILPLKMRYAGPREAIMHALIRKNFGCTHFIVGRDHAGVGNYYHPEAAQEIFKRFSQNEIGITILKYPEVVYSKSRNEHCFVEECEPEDRINFSGTKLREKIKAKEPPPARLIRPEVYHLLANSSNSLVDTMYKNNISRQGFVLWFTGLSASGKSTIADKVYAILAEHGIKIERLDGDIARENLTKDLGFSKEDRDENIRRIGFMARLLARNGVGVLASFISPYRRQRDELRMKISGFIEVFVDAPLAVCEERDRKGLYKKARAGEIKNFTGISDPYEEPKSPEIHLRTDALSADQCAEDVVRYLEEKEFVRDTSNL